MHRGAFRNAVQSIHYGRFDEAIRALNPLVVDYPYSPLAWFYLGMAKDKAGNVREADENYARALNSTNAEAGFRAWSKYEPDIARQLEAVGTTLRGRNLYHDPSIYNLSRRASQIAVQLNPRLEAARYDLALMENWNENYSGAHSLLTEIIEAAESRHSQADRNKLLFWYQTRANVLLSWGIKFRRQGLSAASTASKTRYLDALNDLGRGDKLLTSHDNDEIMRADYKILKAKVMIALADLEGILQRPSIATGLYREVLKLSEQSPPGSPKASEMDQLRMEVEKRLKAPAPH